MKLKLLIGLIILISCSCQNSERARDCIEEKRLLAIMNVKSKMDYEKITDLEDLIEWYIKQVEKSKGDL